MIKSGNLNLSSWAKLFAFATVIFITGSASVSAYEPDIGGGGSSATPQPIIELEKRQGADQRLTALGSDLMGDGIDPHSGTIQFDHTDVSLPGNTHLEVAIKRKRRPGLFYDKNTHVEFGDWQLDVPRIHVTIPSVRSWTGNRCSNSFAVSFPAYSTGGVNYYGYQYTNGLTMDAPGAGGQQVLENPTGSQWPTGTTHVTASGWRFQCISAIGGGQGFLGIAPNGDKYEFNKYYAVDANPISNTTTEYALPRKRQILAATKVTDVNGNTVDYTYDGANRLTRISSSDGRRIDIYYNGSSKLISSVIANPGTADSRTWTYSYATKSFPDYRNGNVLTVYRSNALSQVTLPDGRKWQFDIAGMDAEPGWGILCLQGEQTLTITHPFGTVGTFKVSILRQRTSLNRKMKVGDTCPNNNVPPPSPPYTYEMERALIMAVKRKELSGPLLSTMTWTYSYEYDSGAPGSSASDPTNWTKMTDPLGHETTYYHRWNNDVYGGKLDRVELRESAGSSPIRVTNNTYVIEDNLGGQLAGSATTPPSNARPTHVTSTVINQEGDTYTTNQTYNTNQSSSSYSWGHPTQTEVYSSFSGSTDPRTTATTYLHKKDIWVLGLPTQLTTNGRDMASFTYDNLGRKTVEKRYGQSVEQWHWYYYDSRQRICRYRESEGGDTIYQYDAAGQMTAYQKGLANGTSCATPSGTAKVSLTYDNLGRLTNTDFADSGTPDIARTYDANGNVKTVNRNGVNWTYEYNNINLVTSESLALDGRSYNLSYAYDGVGNLSSRTFPTGRMVEYNPDGLGRARQAKWGSTYYANNISYHEDGSLAGLTYGNNQVFTRTLNARQLPEHLLSQKGSTNKALDLTYGYDSRGLITTITNGIQSVDSRTYGYDGLGQLTSASGPWGSGSYSYDSLGNLRTKQLGNRSISLTYDVDKNRVIESEDTCPPNQTCWGGNTGTRGVTHDARGNVIALGGLNFTYDYSDQPVAVSGTAPGSGAVSGNYKYDGNKKRVRANTNGKLIYNVFDHSGALVHIDNLATGKQIDYVAAGGMTIARVENNAPVYLHMDHLGSAVTRTNTDGSVQWRERYSPYGIIYNDHAANDDMAGFTGHIRDADTGLSYMQARYYDPVMGRFLSIDPVGYSGKVDTGMFNRYAYTLNNPTNLTDPDGECPPCAIVIAAAVAVEVAEVVLTVGAAATVAVAAEFYMDQAVSKAEAQNDANKPEAHDPRPLTDGERKKLSDAGKQSDKGGRTKAGRAGEKHGSRPGSAFPPTSGDADSINDQGQEVLDGILGDEGSTIEVDGRGRTTVTAPDGRGARYNPDGTMQGFREPEKKSLE